MVKNRVPKKASKKTSVRSSVRALKAEVRKKITKDVHRSKKRAKPSIASREVQMMIAGLEVETQALRTIEKPSEKRQEETVLRGKVEALKKRLT
jgi:hypothetical protein